MSASAARRRNPAAPGVDYNGDGDFLDTVRFYTPNNTNTNRLGLTASLIWDITTKHRVRVAYTFDRAHHRQTGEWGFLNANGDPESPFSGRNATPVLDANGFQFQQRDRTSIAMLNQIAAQYIGRFVDNRLRVEIGVRAPFFKRELDQRLPDRGARRAASLIARASRTGRRRSLVRRSIPIRQWRRCRPPPAPTPYLCAVRGELQVRRPPAECRHRL